MTKIQIPTAKIFEPLLQPARYKGAYGGRGSGKSHFFAGLMVEEHLLNHGQRSVCIREVQKTLKDSAKRLIDDIIDYYGLSRYGFRSYVDRIETPRDGLIIFQGMQDHNAESIKSLEGFDRAWVEEAQTLTKTSLQLLRPTIRANNSELWFSWNPRRKIDPVDELLRGEQIPTNSVVVRANWADNPWFPDVLEQERQDDLIQRPDSYDHVWEGGYITAQDGAYYARHLAQAKLDNRICTLPVDPLMSTYAFFDIGGTGAKADACAIWVLQFVGKEARCIDYYEAVGQELSAHVMWLRDNGYGKANVYLPHDGVKHDFVYRVTYESELKKAGFNVTIVENQGSGAANQRIEAARSIFPYVWFDKQKCSAGIEALGWYHEKKHDARNIGLGPEHDWSSHGADAFGMMAIMYPDLTRTRQKRNTHHIRPPGGGWQSM